jgi:lipoate-protein ligase B
MADAGLRLTLAAPIGSGGATARLTWAGRLPLARAIAANAAAVARVEANGIAELLAFEPAAPAYTLGKRAQTPAGRAALAPTLALCRARGIEVIDVDRGGLGTLHAPGQLVVFVAWPCDRAGLRPLVARLLGAAAAVCAELGVAAEVDLGERVGLWHAGGEVGQGAGKLASLGLAHGNGVARHGLALNVAIDPELNAGLALCGNACAQLANLSRLASSPQPPLAELATALAARIARTEGA